jgi:hypothetical protein
MNDFTRFPFMIERGDAVAPLSLESQVARSVACPKLLAWVG